MAYGVTLLIGKDTKEIFENFTYFMIHATIEIGNYPRSTILNLPWENRSPNKEQWEWVMPTGDDKPRSTDHYLKQPQPIPINNIIAALKKDIRIDGYIPAIWAVALLESILNNSVTEEFSVLLYGH